MRAVSCPAGGAQGTDAAYRSRQTGFRFRKNPVGCFRGRLFLARLPKARDLAGKSGGVVIEGNQAREALVTRSLRRTGWCVLHVWEHDSGRKNQARLFSRIERALIRQASHQKGPQPVKGR